MMMFATSPRRMPAASPRAVYLKNKKNVKDTATRFALFGALTLGIVLYLLAIADRGIHPSHPKVLTPKHHHRHDQSNAAIRELTYTGLDFAAFPDSLTTFGPFSARPVSQDRPTTNVSVAGPSLSNPISLGNLTSLGNPSSLRFRGLSNAGIPGRRRLAFESKDDCDTENHDFACENNSLNTSPQSLPPNPLPFASALIPPMILRDLKRGSRYVLDGNRVYHTEASASNAEVGEKNESFLDGSASIESSAIQTGNNNDENAYSFGSSGDGRNYLLLASVDGAVLKHRSKEIVERTTTLRRDGRSTTAPINDVDARGVASAGSHAGVTTSAIASSSEESRAVQSTARKVQSEPDDDKRDIQSNARSMARTGSSIGAVDNLKRRHQPVVSTDYTVSDDGYDDYPLVSDDHDLSVTDDSASEGEYLEAATGGRQKVHHEKIKEEGSRTYVEGGPLVIPETRVDEAGRHVHHKGGVIRLRSSSSSTTTVTTWTSTDDENEDDLMTTGESEANSAAANSVANASTISTTNSKEMISATTSSSNASASASAQNNVLSSSFDKETPAHSMHQRRHGDTLQGTTTGTTTASSNSTAESDVHITINQAGTNAAGSVGENEIGIRPQKHAHHSHSGAHKSSQTRSKAGSLSNVPAPPVISPLVNETSINETISEMDLYESANDLKTNLVNVWMPYLMLIALELAIVGLSQGFVGCFVATYLLGKYGRLVIASRLVDVLLPPSEPSSLIFTPQTRITSETQKKEKPGTAIATNEMVSQENEMVLRMQEMEATEESFRTTAKASGTNLLVPDKRFESQEQSENMNVDYREQSQKSYSQFQESQTKQSQVQHSNSVVAGVCRLFAQTSSAVPESPRTSDARTPAYEFELALRELEGAPAAAVCAALPAAGTPRPQALAPWLGPVESGGLYLVDSSDQDRFFGDAAPEKRASLRAVIEVDRRRSSIVDISRTALPSFNHTDRTALPEKLEISSLEKEAQESILQTVLPQEFQPELSTQMKPPKTTTQPRINISLSQENRSLSPQPFGTPSRSSQKLSLSHHLPGNFATQGAGSTVMPQSSASQPLDYSRTSLDHSSMSRVENLAANSGFENDQGAHLTAELLLAACLDGTMKPVSRNNNVTHLAATSNYPLPASHHSLEPTSQNMDTKSTPAFGPESTSVPLHANVPEQTRLLSRVIHDTTSSSYPSVAVRVVTSDAGAADGATFRNSSETLHHQHSKHQQKEVSIAICSCVAADKRCTCGSHSARVHFDDSALNTSHAERKSNTAEQARQKSQRRIAERPTSMYNGKAQISNGNLCSAHTSQSGIAKPDSLVPAASAFIAGSLFMLSLGLLRLVLLAPPTTWPFIAGVVGSVTFFAGATAFFVTRRCDCSGALWVTFLGTVLMLPATGPHAFIGALIVAALLGICSLLWAATARCEIAAVSALTLHLLGEGAVGLIFLLVFHVIRWVRLFKAIGSCLQLVLPTGQFSATVISGPVLLRLFLLLILSSFLLLLVALCIFTAVSDLQCCVYRRAMVIASTISLAMLIFALLSSASFATVTGGVVAVEYCVALIGSIFVWCSAATLLSKGVEVRD